jgi:hypothetical protein
LRPARSTIDGRNRADQLYRSLQAHPATVEVPVDGKQSDVRVDSSLAASALVASLAIGTAPGTCRASSR